MIDKIIDNNDNFKILKKCRYLLNVVVNDVEYINDASDLNNEENDYLDLGNNKKIKKEDLESICKLLDTLYFIEQYNKESE